MSRWRDYLDYWCWEITITRVTEAKRATASIINYAHVEGFHLSMSRKWVCTFSPRVFLSLVQRSNPAFPRYLCSMSYGKRYANTVWEAARRVGRASESHTHQATLNGGTAHRCSGSPQLLAIYLWKHYSCKDQYHYLFCYRRLIVLIFHLVSIAFSWWKFNSNHRIFKFISVVDEWRMRQKGKATRKAGDGSGLLW